MGLDTNTVYLIMLGLIVAIVATMILILIYRYVKSTSKKRAETINFFIVSELKHIPDEILIAGKHPCLRNESAFEKQYIKFVQHTRDATIEKKAQLFLCNQSLIKKHSRRLYGLQAHRRIRAAVTLGYIPSVSSVNFLEAALVREHAFYVKLYIVNSLIQLHSPTSISVIINSLIRSPEWYRAKINALLCSLETQVSEFLPEIIESKDPYIEEFIIYYAARHPSAEMLEYLLVQTSSYNISNALKAVEALSQNHHYILSQERFIKHSRIKVRNAAILSLAGIGTQSNIDKLLAMFGNLDADDYVIQAISEILWKRPELVDHVVDRFHDTVDPVLRRNLTDILSNRIEYFVQKTISREKKYIKILLREVLLIGKTSQIIGFLNKNRNEEIESELLKVIGKIIYGKKDIQDVDQTLVSNFFHKKTTWDIADEVIDRVLPRVDLSYLDTIAKSEKDLKNKQKQEIENILEAGASHPHYTAVASIVLKIMLKYEFKTYLNDRVLSKLNLDKYVPLKHRKEELVEKDKIIFLQYLLIGLIVLFPLIYLLKHSYMLSETSWGYLLKLYVIDFNYILVYYSTSINGIYILLLILSIAGVVKQKIFWEVKYKSFLFRDKMLPSISILAPAYNEQETIIESVNSLLNLEYPDYELIVVNDGSPDDTLNVLIDYFSLEKVDRVLNEALNTQPVRGIYANKNIAKLTVIDKTNGGKADALNVGINVACKDFFCGIDSDSLLEPDALVKLASHTLDTDYESVAMGGNVFPINGCTVHKGMLERKRIPGHPLARLQTIEYLRAFMAGRIGWSYINSLIIISGAFSLFRRSRIIEIGGYLTSSGRFHKDTVGEDMELVVRISKHMHEKNINYAVHYAYNANCWTEVPETLKVLSSQRDRWQRGLIDITNFHKKILFNRKYGRMGLVALPYFFIFEMIGPLIEIKGYLMVVAAALLGILSFKIAILLFCSSILMGMLISVMAIFISELEGKQFSLKGLLILMWYAVLENFGPRQYFSYWRAKGFFSAMKKPKGWGTMTRKLKHTILVLSDENSVDLKKLIEMREMSVLLASDVKDALRQMQQESVHLAVFDSADFANGLYIREQLNAMEAKKHIPLLVTCTGQVPENEMNDELLIVNKEAFVNLNQMADYIKELVTEFHKN